MFSSRTNWNLAPNRLSEALARHRAGARPLLDLTASNPTICGFDYDRDAILAALANPQALVYEPEPRGIETARRAVSEYYAARGNAVALDSIFLTASTTEAYSFAFRALCNPDEEILIPAPSYPLFDYLADLNDVRLVRYPLIYDHGWQTDIPSLEAALTPATRGIIVVHPNNPTGHFTKRNELGRFNELCARNKLALIVDEVFLDYAMGAPASFSFSCNEDALTFTMSGLSKISGLPQMKAAWLVTSGPAELKSQALARLEVIADTFLSVNTAVQLALPELLHLAPEFQWQVQSRIGENLRELDRQLQAHAMVNRLAVEGGWYATLRVPATQSDEELAVRLLEERSVYVHPGHFFDFSTEGILVVSLITPPAEFAEGIARVLASF